MTKKLVKCRLHKTNSSKNLRIKNCDLINFVPLDHDVTLTAMTENVQCCSGQIRIIK